MLDIVEVVRPGHLDELELIWFGEENETNRYGQEPTTITRVTHYSDRGEPCCGVYRRGSYYTDITLTVPGEFNIQTRWRHRRGRLGGRNARGGKESASILPRSRREIYESGTL